MTNETPEVHRQHLDYLCWIVAECLQDGKVSARIIAISKFGAKLTTELAQSVPEEFVLNLTEDGLVRRDCRITSREADQIVIVFSQKKRPFNLLASASNRTATGRARIDAVA